MKCDQTIQFRAFVVLEVRCGASGSRTARSTTAGPNILFARHYSFIAIVEECFERNTLLNRFFFPKLTGLKPAEPDVSILQRGDCEQAAH
jgi:hypothetical protein